MADDPDAGVRRELILALRNLPTDKVGDALKTLTATWDGQDRWYLEALGLALEKRESDDIAGLFDGTLFGDLDLDNAGQASQVALAAVFPGRSQRGVHRGGRAGAARLGPEQDARPGLAAASRRGPGVLRGPSGIVGPGARTGRRRCPQPAQCPRTPGWWPSSP